MSISKFNPFQTIYVVKHMYLVCIYSRIMMMMLMMIMMMVTNDDDDDDDDESRVSAKNLWY